MKLIPGTYRVLLNEDRGLESELLFLIDVITDVAQLLLHQTNRLEVGRVIEGVATQQKKL